MNTEECRLLGCGSMWVLLEPTFRRSVLPPSSGWKDTVWLHSHSELCVEKNSPRQKFNLVDFVANKFTPYPCAFRTYQLVYNISIFCKQPQPTAQFLSEEVKYGCSSAQSDEVATAVLRIWDHIPTILPKFHWLTNFESPKV
jgi:hypothetical protein